MNIRFRTMTPIDIAGGMRLKTAAGWNQTEADWRRFLDSDPEGTFVAEFSGRIVGTVATIIYENRIAWIGMMLVDPEFRRRGVGEGLMRMALDHLRFRRIAVIGLDATPMGRPLYERLGFVATSSLHRWSLDRDGKASNLSHPIDAHEIHEFDLNAICRLDRIAFGADRSRLIRSFVNESPTRVVTCNGSHVSDGSAVLIARPGAVADHLGAWLAPSAADAAKLLDLALACTAMPVVIADVPSDHAWARAVLSARGFRIARDLTRMYLADAAEVAQPVGHAAILGPEFG